MDLWKGIAFFLGLAALVVTILAYSSDRSLHLRCLERNDLDKYVCSVGRNNRFVTSYYTYEEDYDFIPWFQAFMQDSGIGRGVRYIMYIGSALVFVMLIAELLVSPPVVIERGAGSDDPGAQESLAANVSTKQDATHT